MNHGTGVHMNISHIPCPMSLSMENEVDINEIVSPIDMHGIFFNNGDIGGIYSVSIILCTHQYAACMYLVAHPSTWLSRVG